MAGLLYPGSDVELAYGLSRDPGSVAQASGLGNIAPSSADAAVQMQAAQRSMADAFGAAGAQIGRQALEKTPQQPGGQILFDQASNKMFAGGSVFDPGDVNAAFTAAQRLGDPTPPPQGFTGARLTPEGYRDYLNQLASNRGFMGNLGIGAQNTVGALVGGTGRVLETTGLAPETGAAIAGFSDKYIEPSQNEQARSALIASRQTGTQNFFDAVVQAIPSLATSVLGGVGGAALAGNIAARAGLAGVTATAGATTAEVAAAATALNRVRNIGSLTGVVATTFPGEVKGLYEAAANAKNPDGSAAYDVNDPAVRAQILAAAASSTAIQSWADHGLAKGMSMVLRKEIDGVAKYATRTAAVSRQAGMGAFSEAFAEGTAELIQKATFDPEFRSKLNVNDMKMLAPYIIDKYGYDIAMAAGVGAVLGAGTGGITGMFTPIDLNKNAGDKAKAEAPVTLAPPDASTPFLPKTVGAQGELFPEMLGLTGNPAARRPPAELSPIYPPVPTGQLELPFATGVPQRTTQTGPLPPSMPPNLTGMPLFGSAPTQGELFPGGAQQTAPSRYYEPQQLNLPLGGQQLELPLAPPAPSAPSAPTVAPATNIMAAPAADTALGAALLRAQQAKAERDTAPNQRERNRLQKILDKSLAQVETQMAQDAQAQADILPQGTLAATGIPQAGTTMVQGQEQLPLFVPGRQGNTEGKQRSDRAEALRNKVRSDVPGLLPAQSPTQTTSQREAVARERALAAQGAAPAPVTYGPSSQMELFTKKGTPTAAVVKANEAALKKGTSNATQVGQVQQGSQQQYQNTGGRLEEQPQNRNVASNLKKGGGKTGGGNRTKQGTASQGEVTPPKPEGVVSTAPAIEQNQSPTQSQTSSEGNLTGAGGSIANPNVATTTGRTTSLTEGAKRLAELHNRRVTQPEVAVTTAPPTIEVPVETSFGPSTITGEAAAVISKFEKALSLAQNNLNNLQNMAGSLDPDVYNKRATKLEADIKAAQDGMARAQATANAQAVNNTAPGTGKYSLADWNTTGGSVDTQSGAPTTPMNVGRVRMLVNNIISKLSVKPDTHVFRNQADMKASNPALYAQAVGARPQGDFDKANAAGYSFTHNGIQHVVIFSDRIAHQQHLQFVVAHETLGHFGLRGIMPQSNFDSIMESLYNENPYIKAEVDAAMLANEGMSTAEAVEEYLSDYAGLLDTSLLRRIWNSIKGFLNNVGIRFGDEAMRYVLDQARRYVRTGQTSSAFDAEAIGRRINQIDSGNTGTGRFAQGPLRVDMSDFSHWIHDKTQDLNLDAALKMITGQDINTREKWNNFASRYLSLATFTSNENAGLNAFVNLTKTVSHRDAQVLNTYNARIGAIFGGNQDLKETASKLLYAGRDLAIWKTRTTEIDYGTAKLITTDKDGNPTINTAEVDRLRKYGIMTLAEAKDGITIKNVPAFLNSNAKEDRTFKGIPDLTEEQYNAYVGLAKAMNDIEVDLLMAKYTSVLSDQDVSRESIKRLMKTGDFTAADSKFLAEATRLYKQIYTEGMTKDARGRLALNTNSVSKSNKFAELLNEAMIARESDKNANLNQFFANQKQTDDFLNMLEDFKSRRIAREELEKSPKKAYIFQNEIKRIITSEANFDKAERETKEKIAEGYTPIYREGSHQMRITAYVDGKPVKLSQEHQDMLVFSLFENPSDARNASDAFNNKFKDSTYSALVEGAEGQVETKDVRLVASYGSAVEQISTDPSLNLDTFLHGLRLFGINPTPDVMADIITTLTETSNSARSKLAYSETPGYNPNDAWVGVAEHIRGRASIISKTESRPAMRELLDRSNPKSMELWNGNEKYILALKKEVAAQTDPDRKAMMQRELNSALYMYKQTHPDVKSWDGSEETLPSEDQKGYSRANEFYNMAGRTLAMLENNKYVDASDLESGKKISMFKAFATTAQLGMTPVQGIMNLTSIYTNWGPWMATYNEKNNFGGGFGYGKAMSEYHTAFGQVGLSGLTNAEVNTAAYYDNYANDAKLQKIMTANEAKYLADEINGGRMQPASINNLLSVALDHVQAPWAQKAISVMMAPFNLTEQASRRSAGLAAYRLDYARSIAAGRTAVEADAAARLFAGKSLDETIGDYSILNRPPAWRQGLPSLLYMYKVFPVTTVQLIKNLNPAGRVMVLGTMMFMAGAKGLPFAEDMEDLADTLMQQLGMKSGSVRAEFTKMLDDIQPGLASLVINGVVHQFGLSGDVGAKFSMGNMVPGTGIFLAGAKTAIEGKDLTGPMGSFAMDAAATARDMVMFPFSEKKSLVDIARSSPVTFLRTVGDAVAYNQNGAIVDRRGYVVSPDMSIGVTIARLLGFYPSKAAEQYEVIKISNRMTGYQKEVTSAWRIALLKAEMTGDTDRAASIREAVANWNEETRGTLYEMRNFERSYQRMKKEASRPAGERTIKAAPKGSQEDIRRLFESLTD
jgi:hypothetical protein